MEQDRGGWRHLDSVYGVRADPTGDAQNEMLQESSGLPIGQESFFVFSRQGKRDLDVGFETSLFKEESDTMRFSYPAAHPLAAEFEEQMCKLVREKRATGNFWPSITQPSRPPTTTRRLWR